MFRRSIRVVSTAIVLLGLVTVGGAWAAKFKDLSAHDLKSKMDSGETILLINPLSDIEFDQSHIPGSVNISLHKEQLRQPATERHLFQA